MDENEEETSFINPDENEEDCFLFEYAEFSTFTDLEEAIRMYEDKNFCKLYKRNSRSITSAKRRAPHRLFNPEIIFTEIKLQCIHGGKAFKSRSTGLRPNQRYVMV